MIATDARRNAATPGVPTTGAPRSGGVFVARGVSGGSDDTTTSMGDHGTRRERQQREMPFIRCAGCGKVLASQVAGCQVIVLHGRRILAQVLSMSCERCGTVWMPPERAAEVEVVNAIERRVRGDERLAG